MLKLLKIILKIILAPLILVLSFLIFLYEKVISLAAGFAIILSVIFGVFGVYCLFDPVYRWSALPAIISAFLLSPMGIPLIGTLLLIIAENLRDWLKSI